MGHLIGNEYLQDHLVEVAKNIVLAIKKAPTITGKTSIRSRDHLRRRYRSHTGCPRTGGQGGPIRSLGLPDHEGVP